MYGKGHGIKAKTQDTGHQFYMAHLEPGTPIRGYFIQQRIGEGAAGVAYEALTRDNKPVVLKCVPLKKRWFKAEYLREVTALRQCNGSEVVVKMIDYFAHGSLGVLVLEKLDMDLIDYLEEEDCMSLQEAKIVFKQVCLAIKALHDKKIAHLDIKPDNIFMNDIDDVRLGDLGSCFQWSEENTHKRNHIYQPQQTSGALEFCYTYL